jgi:hypothetical protein
MTLIVADRLTYVLAFVVMELRPLEHKPKLFSQTTSSLLNIPGRYYEAETIIFSSSYFP